MAGVADFVHGYGKLKWTMLSSCFRQLLLPSETNDAYAEQALKSARRWRVFGHVVVFHQ
jgi:hypothetical protein